MSRYVLLIQDDPLGVAAIRKALSADGSFEIEWVRTCAEGIERLSRQDNRKARNFIAVLVDLFLPDSHGIETIYQLFRAVLRPDSPTSTLA